MSNRNSELNPTLNRATEPSLLHLWWLLFRNLAVPTLLFLVPLLVTQSLHGLSFLVGTRGALAEVALESLAILGLEALFAAVLAAVLKLLRLVRLIAWRGYLPIAGALAVVAATGCLLEFLSPLEGLVGAMACGAIQIGAVVVEIVAFSLLDWRAVFRVFNRLNRSAQYVVALAPLLLLGAAMGGFGWRSFDAMPRGAAADPAPAPDRPNIILVSFDAMAAQDMSLYGYARATTPAFVRLAGQSYNFVNFSSTADFTSPAVASLLTGQYPLRHRVFELYGHIPRRAQSHNLAWVLRHHGYTTAAIVTNPGAHPLALHIGSSFSYLPWPPITPWFIAGTFLLQLRHSLLYTSADALSLLGARLLGFAFPSFNQHGWVSARAVFAAARQFIRGTPQPYFLWLHIYPPHAPYVSDPPFRGRFLRGDEFATQEQFLWSLPGPPYAPAQQPIVDKLRLRYDESLAEADNALGQFVQWLDRSGRRQHVLLIVTADHGESFEAGWLGHGSPYLRYAETHIPLLISMPGQHQGAIRAQDADLSDVAPTVLAALGIATPPWMDGHALLGAAAAPAEPSFAMYLVQSSPQGPPPTGILAATANGRRLIWFFPQNALVLYDLRSDPNQLHDISFLHPQTVADLMAALRARFRAQVDMAPRAPAL